MSRYLVIALMGLPLAGMLYAAPAPRIVVDEPAFDFGEQANTQVIEHTFVVRNEGDLTLEIQNIRSSCGCTVGNISSRSVEPGGTSEITAAFNLRGRQGNQRSVLTLETNDPAQPRTQLTMGGVALQDMQIRPRQLFFGQVYAGHGSSREIELIGMPDQPFEITDIINSSAHFQVEPAIQRAPHSYVIPVSVKPPAEEGTVQTMLEIRTTHPNHRTVHVPLNAQVAGPIAVAPRAITLMGGSDAPVTRYVVLRPGAIEAFEVTQVVAPSDDIRVQVLVMPNQGYRIQLSNVRASEVANTSLRIETNVEGMPYVEVPFEIIDPPS